MATRRRDYAFPFRIDSGSRQAAEATYGDHVRQMIRQVLLTSPGERADLPEFGCGLRQLIFAPHSEALDATTQMLVQESLTRWLAEYIEVHRVHVATPEESPDAAQLLVTIEYILIETRGAETATVRIGP
jgi:phage baseplate assembly protein W